MPELILKVEQGLLEGCSETTEEGFKLNCYKGIPYAKPPVGLLRFKDPQLPEAWEGVRDAKAEGLECAQKDLIFSQNYTGSEDCLFLNVSTPSSANEFSKLPVMFFVHGGGFRTGSGNANIYGPDRLVSKDVVLVTFNYRLGPLGFMCLNNPDIPGNAGLKDQVYALRWVQRNIAVFGGNPENVTIFGDSAGAASVHYLMMSMMASGLFKRSIIQSGSCISNWATQTNPVDNVYKLAQDLGCKATRLEDVARFLREVPVDDLINKTYVPYAVPDDYWCLPVVEFRMKGVETFLSNHPLDLMKSGRYNTVPCIYGYNSQEGIIFMNKIFIQVEDFSKLTDLSQVKVDLKQLVKALGKTRMDSGINELCRKIKAFYFKDDTQFMEGYINLLTDMQFGKDIDTCIEMMKKHSVVYSYNFKYNGASNLCQGLTDYPYTEASHSDQLGYIFKIRINDPDFKTTEMSADDKMVSEKLVTLYTNFAKYDDPTPEINDVITETWKPVNLDERNCLDIDRELKLTQDPYGERMGFWKKLLDENNKPAVKVSYDFNSRMSFWKNKQKS